MRLREYQRRIICDTCATLQFANRVCVCAPTGAGKTVMAAEIIRRVLAETEGRAVFLAERLTLVDQGTAALQELLDQPVGVMQASGDPGSRVVVASQQTVEARGWPQDIGLAVLDEAHIQRTELLSSLPASTLAVGLTATPLADGMTDRWDALISRVTTRSLMDSGHLVPDVRVLTHDTNDVLADAAEHWGQHAAGRPTIVAAASVSHAHRLAEALPGPWRVCWYGDSRSSRRAKVEQFRRGETPGLISVDALGRGFDAPQASCLLVCRPMRSLTTWLQWLGRVMRPAPDKTDALVLDCSGTWQELGADTQEFWTYGPPSLKGQRAKDQQSKNGSRPSDVADGPDPETRKGIALHAVPTAAPPPGLSRQRHWLWLAAETTGGDLTRIWRELLAIAKEAGSPDPRRRALASYRAITGHWPASSSGTPASPSAGVRAAARLSYAAWRKGKKTS